MANIRPIVEPPAFSSLPHGLWEVAAKPTAPSHWQHGVTWIERCPTGATTYDECLAVTGTDAPPAPPTKSDNVDQTFRGATAFTVYARFDCSPIGLGTDEINSVARDALERIESRQVETAFWTGTAGGQSVVFPRLAASTEVLDSDGIVLQSAASVCITGADIAHGLGELEQCLADCYAGQGVIHVPASVLPTMDAWGLVQARGDRLVTRAGNRVVVGGGYPGTGPAGQAAAAGTSWIYATGAVFGYRGSVFATRLAQSFDRAENSIQMLAERTYVLGFECCLLAALVNLGVPDS